MRFARSAFILPRWLSVVLGVEFSFAAANPHRPPGELMSTPVGIIPPARCPDSSTKSLGAARYGVIRGDHWEAMVMTVSVTREDLSPVELRRAAGRTSDAAAARRMLAIALVLEGHPRAAAARQCGMDRQTLRDWVHRYNAEGVAGLSDRAHRGGAQPRLLAEQQKQVADWVRAGPQVEKDGVVRWRRVDLQGKIAEMFKVHLHERSGAYPESCVTGPSDA